MRKPRLAGATLAALVAVPAFGASAHAASADTAPGLSPLKSAVATKLTTRTSAPAGTVAEWGVTSGGKYYSFTYHVAQGRPASAPASPQVTAGCSDYISDVELLGGGSSARYFQWTTSQTCVGAFGVQSIRTQMWRSSWSGPRGYNAWTTSQPTTNAFTNWGWSTDCNWGNGTYDYYPVMQGYATGVGYGPILRSNNQLTENCGPNA